MTYFVANPIDSVMHLYNAEDYPCHLLIECQQPISRQQVQKTCNSKEVLSRLTSAKFLAGGWGRTPKWKVGSVGLIEIEEHRFKGEFEFFCPDKDLPILKANFRITLIDTPAGVNWLVLSWTHTLTDARGGEELLRIIADLPSKSCIAATKPIELKLSGLNLFGKYCRQRRMAATRPKLISPKRHYVTLSKDLLWGNDTSPFFRSASLLAALLKAQDSTEIQICAIPVLQARSRVFPSNHLGLLHLSIDPIGTFKDVNLRILGEMERVVREGLPKRSMQALALASRFGRTVLKAVSNYPAKNRFADLCLSSLGTSILPINFFQNKVLRIRHYPPIFPWGGSTLVYYDYGSEATLCLIGGDLTLIEKTVNNLLAKENTP